MNINKTTIILMLFFAAVSAPAQDDKGKEYPTPKGAVRAGMNEVELYEIFPEHHRIAIPHNVRGERWIIFKNWTSKDPNDAITFYLKNGEVVGWRENYNPFPENKGSRYEYNQNEKIDMWFFPSGKARWNGEKMNALEWNILTDSQKVMFLTEYIKQINEQFNSGLNIDINKYILAMNHYSDTCPEECRSVPMTTVVNDLLISEGKAVAKNQGS